MNQPYRSHQPYGKPLVVSTHPLVIQVAIPNEEPDQDDLTISITLTEEGIMADYFASDGPPAATFGQTWMEFTNTIALLDPDLQTLLGGF
jgi:hypothetical protein